MIKKSLKNSVQLIQGNLNRDLICWSKSCISKNMKFPKRKLKRRVRQQRNISNAERLKDYNGLEKEDIFTSITYMVLGDI